MEKEQVNVKRHIIPNIIYFVIVIGLTALAFYLTVGNKVNQVFETLSSTNLWYIFAIIGILLACILARSIALFALTRIFDKKYLFHRAISVDQIGSLYRMITPAGLGGHVGETVVYKKQGIRISNALSILAMYSIVYQVVLIIYGAITIIIKRDLVNQIAYLNINGTYVSLWLLIAIGFAFNIVTIGFILLLSYWEPFYKFIKGPIYSLLAKFRLIKDLDTSRAHLDESKDNFRNNLKTLLKHVPTLLVSMLMFIIYITLSYSVPYIVGLSLGNASEYANFWDSVLLSNFHQMVTCIIPLPGSSGISELFFYSLFYPSNGPKFYSTDEIARASLLLWRSLVYIIPLLISLIYTLVYRLRKKTIKDDHQED